MPKIDQNTGCEVMTVPEFWNAEAKREGRSAAELEQEFYAELDAEEKQLAEEMKEPAAALKTIKRMVSPNVDNDLNDIRSVYGFAYKDIVSCLTVLDSDVSLGYRKQSSGFQAVVLLHDGTTRTVEYEKWETSGGMYEPPDGDEDISVLAVGTVPVVYRYEDTCAPAKQYKQEQKTRLPMCECCKMFGGVAVNGNVNPAKYMVPASTDCGVTVSRWVLVCVVHVHQWEKGAGYIGPRIELKQRTPNLPWVGEKIEMQ